MRHRLRLLLFFLQRIIQFIFLSGSKLFLSKINFPTKTPPHSHHSETFVPLVSPVFRCLRVPHPFFPKRKYPSSFGQIFLGPHPFTLLALTVPPRHLVSNEIGLRSDKSSPDNVSLKYDQIRLPPGFKSPEPLPVFELVSK